MPILNKLLGWAFLAVAAVVSVYAWTVNLSNKGRALEKADSNESELEAMRDRDDYIEEIESRNRGISDDELYDGLRSHANKNSD